MTTGYFADLKTWTKVHIVNEGKPVCGAKIGKGKIYQKCANGVYIHIIECRRCIKSQQNF